MTMATAGIKSLLKRDKMDVVRCPNCTEQLPSDVIVCKHCGVNINSFNGVDKLNHLTNRTKMQKFKDYVGNLNGSDIKFIAFIVVLAVLIVYWVGSLLF